MSVQKLLEKYGTWDRKTGECWISIPANISSKYYKRPGSGFVEIDLNTGLIKKMSYAVDDGETVGVDSVRLPVKFSLGKAIIVEEEEKTEVQHLGDMVDHATLVQHKILKLQKEIEKGEK